MLWLDIAQRHMRELLERDFNNLKQDIRMLEKIDFDKIRVEIAEIEKKVLPHWSCYSDDGPLTDAWAWGLCAVPVVSIAKTGRG